MSEFEKIAVEQILKSELGPSSHFYEYKPNSNYVLDLVLENARTQIGDIFSIFCVDGGFPEVFCLKGFSKSPVVFNSRYIAFLNTIKKIIFEKNHQSHLVEITEAIALKLISELALRRGDVDFAVMAFIKSSLIPNIPSHLREYDRHPRQIDKIVVDVDVTYIITWFYGLVHELGHFEKVQDNYQTKNGTFSDESLINLIYAILRSHEHLDFNSLRSEIDERINNKKSKSIININHLRNESLADFFSLNVLFQTALKIKVHQQGYDLYSFLIPFIKEITIAPLIISFMEECRQASKLASIKNYNHSIITETRLYPLAMIARSTIQTRGLKTHIQLLLNNLRSTTVTQQEIESFIDSIVKTVNPEKVLEKIGQGRNNAVAFCLNQQKTDKQDLLQQYEFLLSRYDASITTETLNFIGLAKCLNKSSKYLTKLEGMI